jgi:hypothetical protein
MRDCIRRQEQLHADDAVDIGTTIRSQKEAAFRQITRQRGKTFIINEEFYGKPLDEPRMPSSFFTVFYGFSTVSHMFPIKIVSSEIIKESILPW